MLFINMSYIDLPWSKLQSLHWTSPRQERLTLSSDSFQRWLQLVYHAEIVFHSWSSKISKEHEDILTASSQEWVHACQQKSLQPWVVQESGTFQCKEFWKANICYGSNVSYYENFTNTVVFIRSNYNEQLILDYVIGTRRTVATF